MFTRILAASNSSQQQPKAPQYASCWNCLNLWKPVFATATMTKRSICWLTRSASSGSFSHTRTARTPRKRSGQAGAARTSGKLKLHLKSARASSSCALCAPFFLGRFFSNDYSRIVLYCTCGSHALSECRA